MNLIERIKVKKQVLSNIRKSYYNQIGIALMFKASVILRVANCISIQKVNKKEENPAQSSVHYLHFYVLTYILFLPAGFFLLTWKVEIFNHNLFLSFYHVAFIKFSSFSGF